MKQRTMQAVFYDTKPYDRDYFSRADGVGHSEWEFHEFRLSSETAATAQGEQAVSGLAARVSPSACPNCVGILRS